MRPLPRPEEPLVATNRIIAIRFSNLDSFTLINLADVVSVLHEWLRLNANRGRRTRRTRRTTSSGDQSGCRWLWHIEPTGFEKV